MEYGFVDSYQAAMQHPHVRSLIAPDIAQGIRAKIARAQDIWQTLRPKTIRKSYFLHRKGYKKRLRTI